MAVIYREPEGTNVLLVQHTQCCGYSLLRHKQQCITPLFLYLQRLLVSFIEERLHALEETRAALQTDIRLNEARGEALEVLVRERCPPVELERYSLFIGDLERVVSLLLCLSARLARVQNALSTVDQHTDAEERVRTEIKNDIPRDGNSCKFRKTANPFSIF